MMNAKIIAVLFACCVLAILAGSADAVKCYVCNTGDPGCDDSFDSNKMTAANMKSGCTACSKSKGKILGIQATSRDCSLTAAPFDGCKSQSEAGLSGTACFCKSDLCNSSDRVSIATTLLALPALAYIAFRLSIL
ncbi:uncharacterized protein LOC127843078 [Dreissena polymorpha]|uniref:Protein quiver n=1 Tax=Dreissena polymorpha TaxID=45954 RepID=A0A9D4IUD4_DREPO|nr:uncharacterized protein LOC127843078 [Dreissena polymorpha]KAH3785122.1 hypothetical protein DPMN_163207 [Dreissena polymorpha]